MGSSSSPDLPSAPTYQTDPIFSQGYQSLFDYGTQLSKGDFSGNLAWLQPTIDPNNSANALLYAQGMLQPQFRDTLQQITNSAAANNQLNSSTFTDALAKSQSDVNSQYQSIMAQQAINDSNQSNANRLNLFGTGLNTIQNATQFGFGNQNSQNQFNLQNYENQVAAILASQGDQSGGLMGGLLGAGGGGLLATAGLASGLLTGPIGLTIGAGALLGGAAGALSPQSSNLGGSLLGSGAGLLGSSLQAQQLGNLGSLLKNGGSAPSAGAFASNGTRSVINPNNFLAGWNLN